MTARDALGDLDAAGRALELALDIAGVRWRVLPFLLHPVPAARRHPRHRTVHPALISEILSLLAGASRAALSPEEPLLPNEPSARVRPASCATCPPTCPRARSPISSRSPGTRSRRTCAISTPSSARTPATRPWTGPAPLACSRHRRAGSPAETPTYAGDGPRHHPLVRWPLGQHRQATRQNRTPRADVWLRRTSSAAGRAVARSAGADQSGRRHAGATADSSQPYRMGGETNGHPLSGRRA